MWRESAQADACDRHMGAKDQETSELHTQLACCKEELIRCQSDLASATSDAEAKAVELKVQLADAEAKAAEYWSRLTEVILAAHPFSPSVVCCLFCRVTLVIMSCVGACCGSSDYIMFCAHTPQRFQVASALTLLTCRHRFYLLYSPHLLRCGLARRWKRCHWVPPKLLSC